MLWKYKKRPTIISTAAGTGNSVHTIKNVKPHYLWLFGLETGKSKSLQEFSHVNCHVQSILWSDTDKTTQYFFRRMESVTLKKGVLTKIYPRKGIPASNSKHINQSMMNYKTSGMLSNQQHIVMVVFESNSTFGWKEFNLEYYLR